VGERAPGHLTWPSPGTNPVWPLADPQVRRVTRRARQLLGARGTSGAGTTPTSDRVMVPSTGRRRPGGPAEDFRP
jgi:hypothetical protein